MFGSDDVYLPLYIYNVFVWCGEVNIIPKKIIISISLSWFQKSGYVFGFFYRKWIPKLIIFRNNNFNNSSWGHINEAIHIISHMDYYTMHKKNIFGKCN